MKYLLAMFFTILTLGIQAQNLSYQDSSIEFEGDQVQTIDVLLSPQVNTIKDKFENWMDENYDVDLDGKKLLFFDKEFLTANGVVIPQISDKKIDLKVKVDETKAGLTKLNVFASFGYNNWITEEDHPYEYAALRSIVYNFISDYLPKYYYQKVDDSTKNLASLSEKRADLKDDVKENEEDINKLEKENKEILIKLKENQDKINRTKSELKRRNSEYKAVKNRVSDIEK